MNASEFVKKIIGDQLVPKESAKAFAPSNIALVKYWGKRQKELNLPLTSSFSISLGDLGTTTEISRTDKNDQFYLNETLVAVDSDFSKRLSAFLNFFRPNNDFYFKIDTKNNIPTAAGLASSASGFAALVKALSDFFQLNLNDKDLSLLARLGSGSACRSIFNGFVEWHGGNCVDGMDSFAEKYPAEWTEFHIGLLELTDQTKPISSRNAMTKTVETSQLYKQWAAKVTQDLADIKTAVNEKDFHALGKIAESNALAMHATMIDTWPPVLFWIPESVAVLHKIWKLRNDGLDIYFTMDAGPNVKLLFLERDSGDIQREFQNVKTINPFGQV